MARFLNIAQSDVFAVDTLDTFGRGYISKYPSYDLAGDQMAYARNVRSDGLSLFRAPGHTAYGSSMGSFKVKVGLFDKPGQNYVLRWGNGSVDYAPYPSTTWTNLISGLNSSAECSFESLDGINATGSATITGTLTGGTVFSATDTGLAMTNDQYIGYVLILTSGTGAGQAKRVLSNTSDTFFIEGSFSVEPVSGTGYELRPSTRNVYITNGVDSARKWNGTTLTTLNDIPKFTDITVYNSRLWGILGNRLYYSEIGVPEYFDRNSNILFDDDFYAVSAVGNVLIAFGKRSYMILQGTQPEDFKIETRSKGIGSFNDKSVFSANNALYFWSYRGCEVFNDVDGNITETYYPISDFIQTDIDGLSVSDIEEGSVGGDDNYIFFSAGNLSYILDIRASKAYELPNRIWSGIDERSFNNFMVLDNVLFMSDKSNGLIYTLSGTTYNGSTINAVAEGGVRRGEGDNARLTKVYQRNQFDVEPSDTPVTTTVKMEFNDSGTYKTLGTIDHSNLQGFSKYFEVGVECNYWTYRFEWAHDKKIYRGTGLYKPLSLD